MSKIVKEFQVNLFSNVEGYGQTISQFSNIINPPIELNEIDFWHCGLSQISFPAYTHNSNEIIGVKDIISLNHESKKQFSNESSWSIKEFCEYLSIICLNNEIYTQDYFQKYLSQENFNSSRWREIFADDFVSSASGDLTITFELKLED